MKNNSISIHSFLQMLRYLKSPYTLFLLILAISLPLFFFRGIGVFDDSVYLKIGELITQGLLPYQDVFDNKPPGIYYLAALIAWVGHKDWLTNRIFLFLFAALLGFIIIKYTKSLWGNQPAYFVAILFPVSYVIAQGYSFHTEQFCAAFGFASLLLVTKNRKYKMLNWTLSGSFLGIAFLFKQVGVIYLISFLLCDLILIFLRQISLTNAVRRCLFLILGFSIVTLVTFLFIFLSGCWSVFYNDVFLGVIPFSEKNIDPIAVIKLWIKTPVSFLIFPVIIFTLSNKNNLKNIIAFRNFYELLLLLLTGILSLLPTLKVNSNTHYIGASLIFLCIAEAVLINYYFQKNNDKSIISQKLNFLVILLLIPYILGILWISKTMIVQNRITSDLSQMSEIRTILNKYTPATTPVFVLSPIAPRLYYMSGRLPYLRYIYYYFNTEIQLNQAVNILFTSDVPISILEIAENNQTDWLSEKDLVELKKQYLAIETSSPRSYHLSSNKIRKDSGGGIDKSNNEGGISQVWKKTCPQNQTEKP